MKKNKKIDSSDEAGKSRKSKRRSRGWTLNQLEAMPLKQFMEECPRSTSTADLRWQRLCDEALSLDVLQEIAQNPRHWDYEEDSGTNYEKGLFEFIADLADEHDVPRRKVSVSSARDAKDCTIGLATHYEAIGFAQQAYLTPLSFFGGETFRFVHPEIVEVLENAEGFNYLLSSPLWLLFKALYYLNGTLSKEQHSLMQQHATMGNCHAQKYLHFAAASANVQGVRQPEPAYVSKACRRNVSRVLSNDDLAHELDVSWECLKTLTWLIDSTGSDWYSDYLGDSSDVAISTDDDCEGDDWDQREDDDDWDYSGYVWKPEFVSLLRRHVAFPLAKLQHGLPVSEEEHERMSWTHEVIADYSHLVEEYMELRERQQ